MKIKQYADDKLAQEIKAAIKSCDGHCPCVLEKYRNADTKCMCKEFLEQGLGFCHCGLYEKTEL